MRTVKVIGMSCDHCVRAVKKALEEIQGVSNVNVDLEKGEAAFEESAPVSDQVLKEKIKQAGYEIG